MEVRFDRDIDPPEDVGPFVPGPEFYAALGEAARERDIDVRYHAVEQAALCMQGAAVKSEAAVQAVELIEHVLAGGLVSGDALGSYKPDGSFAGFDHGECDTFGDDGELARLIGEVVALDAPFDRQAGVTALIMQVTVGVESQDIHRAALTRFVKRQRGERLLRIV